MTDISEHLGKIAERRKKKEEEKYVVSPRAHHWQAAGHATRKPSSFSHLKLDAGIGRVKQGKVRTVGKKLIETWAATKPDWCYQHLGHAKHFEALTEHTPYTDYGRPDRWGWAQELAAKTSIPTNLYSEKVTGLSWESAWGQEFGANLGEGLDAWAEKPVGFSWGRYFAADQQHCFIWWAGPAEPANWPKNPLFM